MLAQQIQQQGGGLLDVFNTLSGGAVGRMAIFALGIMPYISASIIIQLMTTVFPELEAGRYELFEKGRRDAVAMVVAVEGGAVATAGWPD